MCTWLWLETYQIFMSMQFPKASEIVDILSYGLGWNTAVKPMPLFSMKNSPMLGTGPGTAYHKAFFDMAPASSGPARPKACFCK